MTLDKATISQINTKNTENKKTDKLDLIKINNFCASKDIINSVIRKPIKEKIFENHLADKGLISRVYKELLQLNNQKRNFSIKMGKDRFLQ